MLFIFINLLLEYLNITLQRKGNADLLFFVSQWVYL